MAGKVSLRVGKHNSTSCAVVRRIMSVMVTVMCGWLLSSAGRCTVAGGKSLLDDPL